MRKLLGKHYLLIIILIVVFIAAGISYGANHDNLVSRTIQRIFNPIQKLLSSIQGFFTNLYQNISDFKNLQEERDQLSKENSMLKVSKELLKEAQLEIDHLEDILEYNQNLEEIVTSYAKVVTRNPNNWFDSLIIDAGKDDGIVAGMSVIALQEGRIGLVGVVDEVYENNSNIHLLIDPSKNIAAAAKIEGTILGEEPTIFDGIIEGMTDRLGYLQMIYISHEARIDEGAQIISTGLGGFYVPNIPIGELESLESDAYGLLQTAIIKPFIDFTRISDVLIIKSPVPAGYR